MVGQNEDLVWIKGKVITEDDSLSIPLAQVASYKLVQIFACDSIGEFRMTFPKGDSLMITALGFEPKILITDSITIEEDEAYLIPLKRTSYLIRRVDVSGFKEFAEFNNLLKQKRDQQKELDGSIRFKKVTDTLAYTKPTYSSPPPILAAVVQPLSFLYYHTSKSERMKVKSQKILREDKIRSQLTRELVARYIDLEKKELDKFMIYCNINMDLRDQESEESITVKVMDLYQAYQNEEK